MADNESAALEEAGDKDNRLVFKKLFPSPFSANFERSGYIFGLISD